MVDDSGIGPASVPSEGEAGRASAIILAGLFGGSVTVADRYELGPEIGRGGLGVVHRARDLRLDREVALKFPTGASGNPDIVAALEREAKVLARLHHPNIVAVYDVGHSDRGVYLAMELVEGVPMSAWLRDQKPDWRAVLERMRQAAAGLAAAHEAGVVHRDFKPANVMIDAQGRVRVVDFGLAREVTAAVDDGQDTSADSRQTRAAGTPPYMAPEQFDGRVSAASDQFAFCTALYEGVCGRRPWRGRDRGVNPGDPAASAIDRELERNGMPGHLRRAVVRGLAEDPDGRLPSMAALLDALGPRRRRAWHGWAPAAAVAIGGLGAWMLGGEEPCAERGVAAAEILEVTRASPSLFVEEDTGRVQRAAEAWNALDRETCEAHAQGRLSSTLYELRSRCLDRALVTSRLAVATAASGDYLAPKARRAIADALDVTRCEDDEGLLLGAPEAGYDLEKGEEIQRGIDRAHVFHTLGDDAKWLAMLEDVRASIKDRSAVLPDALWLSMQLGEALLRAERVEEAREVLMRALIEAKEHPKWGRTVAMIQVQLAKVAQLQRDYEQAELWITLAEPALASLEQQQYAYAAAIFRASLGAATGEPRQSLAHIERAEAIAARVGDARDSWAGSDAFEAEIEAIRCGALSDLGRQAEALEACEAAVRRFEGIGVESGRSFAALLHNYALLLKRAKDVEAALALYARAARLKEEAGLSEGAASTLENMANLLDASGRHADALEAYERAQTLLKPPSFRWASVHFNRSIAHAGAENWSAAASDAREALDTLRELGPARPSDLYDYEIALGVAEAKCGHRDVAVESLETALRHERPDHDPYSKAELRLALARISEGDRAERLGAEAVEFAARSGDEALLAAARQLVQR